MRNMTHESRRKHRKGAAVVELAVCLPLIVLLTFASLEGANMLFMRQAAVQAAYEAAKSAAKSTGTLASATTIGQEVLTSRNLVVDSMTFNPTNVETVAKGTPIVVTVTLRGDSRSVVGIAPFRGLLIEAQATMMKE